MMRPTAAERRSALVQLLERLRRLGGALEDEADRLHGDLHLTAGQRAILGHLAREGAQTVPAVARAQGVSRQHVQTLVDGLRRRGLTESRANPAHRRSPLHGLTTRGRELAEIVHEREADRLLELAWHCDPEGLRVTLETLGWLVELVQPRRT